MTIRQPAHTISSRRGIFPAKEHGQSAPPPFGHPGHHASDCALILTAVLLATLNIADAFAVGDETKFTIVQLKYRRGNWNLRPNAAVRLLLEVAKRTSIAPRLRVIVASPDDPVIFDHPFIYMSGDREFEPFTEQEIAHLRTFLRFGGILLADSTTGTRNHGFDRSFRREIARIFPDTPLQPLPRDHSIFVSFYLLESAVGRIIASPQIEGVTHEGFTCVIYSLNDIGGAWARDELAGWEFDVVPGGERQRELAFRLGINIVMYALTADYKRDSIHASSIERRRGR